MTAEELAAKVVDTLRAHGNEDAAVAEVRVTAIIRDAVELIASEIARLRYERDSACSEARSLRAQLETQLAVQLDAAQKAEATADEVAGERKLIERLQEMVTSFRIGRHLPAAVQIIGLFELADSLLPAGDT